MYKKVGLEMSEKTFKDTLDRLDAEMAASMAPKKKAGDVDVEMKDAKK